MTAPHPTRIAGPGADPVADLMAFIDGSPTPFHAVGLAAERLTATGFGQLHPTDDWSAPPPCGFSRRDGSLVAWVLPTDAAADTPLRIVGAHTDSPNLRIRPQPDRARNTLAQLGVEVYGGALLNSWLNRDLGVAGRAFVRSEGGATPVCFSSDGPVMTVPQLAIHLDREISEHGLLLDRQLHLSPIWGGVDGSAPGGPAPSGPAPSGPAPSGPVAGFASWVAQLCGVEVTDVLSWDAMAHDCAPSALVGTGSRDHRFLSAPRLDNLCSCHAALNAIVTAAGRRDRLSAVTVVVLFDHEEVGSESATGAASAFFGSAIDRLTAHLRRGLDDDAAIEARGRSLAASWCCSADMAHATHPNYPDRHEPGHEIALGGGPVVKVNSNQRYATDAGGIAGMRLAAEAAGVNLQLYSHRGNLACGSTIGPLVAARMGISTVDVGAPQLSMHAAREVMAVADVVPYLHLIEGWLLGASPG